MTETAKRIDKLDGRRLRAEQSRDAIVDALMALLREGNPRPGARDIATRAGVSLRSVFRHFEDLDALFSVVAEKQTARTRHLFELQPTSGSLAQRVRALVEQRATLFEEIAPMRRAALRLAAFHAPIRRRLGEANAVLRRPLAAVFAAELAGLAAADCRDVLQAVDAATSFAFWETLRGDQKLSVERSKRIVERTVRALVEPAASRV